MPTGSELLRFYSQTQHEGNCLIWTGPVGSHGYGLFFYRGGHHLAHRFSLKVKLGREILPGRWALHDEGCSRLCVRHVREGTPSENAMSAWECGKTRRGKSLEEVAQMAWLVGSGFPGRLVEKAYGVGLSYLAKRKYELKRKAARRQSAAEV